MDALAEVEPIAILTALGFLELTAVERITGGADARIWRFETGGKAYALRVLRPEQKEQARIEMAVGAAAASAGLPVPAVVAAGSWRHHPVHVLDWSPGAPLAHVLQHGAIDLRRARALGIAFGKVQAAIHAVPVPDELADRSLRWQAWGGPDPELQRVLADLPEQRPALLHLDYHPMNVLVEDDRVTAVLDWANARAGDPRADFARTLSI